LVEAAMRFGLGVFTAIVVVGVAAACNGGGGASSPMMTDASFGDAAPPCVAASVVDVFNNNQGLLCPLTSGSTPVPVSFDTAITTSCATLAMKSGDVQYGQCLDYLVWEVDIDGSGNNFSKCFYDVKTRALVGVIFADGTQDQCNMTSYTIQAGSVEAACTVDVGTGLYEDCLPVPEGGRG
jgi:hypothetical protein